jgi:hypothetical protein
MFLRLGVWQIEKLLFSAFWSIFTTFWSIIYILPDSTTRMALLIAE